MSNYTMPHKYDKNIYASEREKNITKSAGFSAFSWLF